MKYTANPVEVNAYRITEVGPPLVDDASRWISMEGNPDSLASPEMMSCMTPVPGDYWVVQSDGYVYLNPKDVFERKYSPVPEWTSWGIVEIAARNPNVASYCGHWESRTVEAEQELAMIDEALARRPVLEKYTNRYSKVMAACGMAAKADKMAR